MTISNVSSRQSYTTNAAVRTFAINFPFQIAGDIQVFLRRSGTEVESTLEIDVDFTVVGSSVVIDPGFAPWATGDFLSIVLAPSPTQLVALPNAGAFASEAVEGALDKQTNLSKRALDLANRSIHLTDGSVTGHGNYSAANLKISNVGAPTADNDAATKSSVAAQIAAAVLTPTTVITAAAATLLDDATTDAMLTTLGGGSKGIAIFKDTTNAAVLTELGVSAFMQTRLTDADDAAARAGYLTPKRDELPLPSLLDNGDFQIWQQGTSFTNVLPAAGGNNDNVYTADQWILLSNGNNIVTLAKTTSAVPAGSSAGVAVTQVAADTKWGLLQIIDSQRSIPRRNQVVSFGVDVQATGSLTGLRMAVMSWAVGAPDAPTRDVVSAWNAASAQITPVVNWTILAESTIAAGGTFARFYAENVTVPAGCNNLAVFIYTNDASFSAGAVVNISGANLVDGAFGQKFRTRPLVQEQAACERFYEKTFPLETFPAAAAGFAGTLTGWLSATDGSPWAHWRFRTPKIKSPTVNTFNPVTGGGATSWRDVASTNDRAATVVNTGIHGTFISATAAAGANAAYAIHATADARF